MNQNLTLGAITFLIWSSLSTWYYVCYIKDLCDSTSSSLVVSTADPEPISTEASVEVQKEESEPATADSKVDTEKAPEPLPPILIKEEKIYFLINTANFTDEVYVDSFVQEILKQTDGREIEIKITGHTCDLGQEAYNLKLSEKRAEKIKSTLMNVGFKLTDITVQAGGEIPMISANPTDAERQKNRKVIIKIKSTDS